MSVDTIPLDFPGGGALTLPAYVPQAPFIKPTTVTTMTTTALAWLVSYQAPSVTPAVGDTLLEIALSAPVEPNNTYRIEFYGGVVGSASELVIIGTGGTRVLAALASGGGGKMNFNTVMMPGEQTGVIAVRATTTTPGQSARLYSIRIYPVN